MTIRRGITAALLAVLYVTINPYWYGDAVWYATDIRRGLPTADAGHLMWRPLGWAAWQLARAVKLDVDPLLVLQVLSGLGTGALILATYHLALRLGTGPSSAVTAAALVAGSHVSLAWGGSGSSYVCAAAAAVAAIVAVLPKSGEAPSARSGACAVLLMLTACGLWAVSVLILPLFAVAAAVGARGSVRRRLTRSAILVLALAMAGLALWGATYYLASDRTPSSGFVAWLSGTSHDIPVRATPMNAARAVLGFLNGFLHVGRLGAVVKAVWLGETSWPSVLGHVPALALIAIFAAGLLGALITAARLVWTGQLQTLLAPGLAVAALLPVAGFAMLWQGSDVERFALALPFVAIAMVDLHGRSRSRTSFAGSLVTSVVVCVGASNVLTLNAPALASGGGLVWNLGARARDVLPARSVLVVTGQDLGPAIWAPTMYFHDLDVVSVLYEGQIGGAAGWQERLAEHVERAERHGGRVSVLSDLMGQPTPGGLPWPQTEYPHPTVREVRGFFRGWKEVSRWQVDRYTFIDLRRSEYDAASSGLRMTTMTGPNKIAR